MKVTKDLLNSFQAAEVLTNGEVRALLSYFDSVRLALLPCPDEYKLVLNDVREKANRLRDMLDARDESSRLRSTPYSTITPRCSQRITIVV